MLPFVISLVALSAVPAQTIGGGNKQLYQFDGAAYADRLGHDVSSAGDVNADGFDDILVGAPDWDNGATDGAAFVYSGADGSILYQFELSQLYTDYGYAVCATGDINADGFDDFAVSAPTHDVGGLMNVGSVFYYSGADGSILRRLDAPEEFMKFGDDIANAGDINADGVPDLLVGAPNTHVGTNIYVGAVFAYSGADGSLLYRWNGETQNDHIGSALSTAGDLNGDGFDDIFWGASSFRGNGLFLAGGAFVRSGADGSEMFRFEGVHRVDYFGASVASIADINADGVPDLLVGAPRHDPNGVEDAGVAYAFSGANGQLLHHWDGSAEGSRFGRVVARSGDINGDGHDDFLISAPRIPPRSASVAYAYSGTDLTVIHQLETSPISDDEFATALASAGDVNGDGYDDVLIGSPRASPPSASFAGSVFVHSFNPFLTTATTSVSAANGGTVDFQLDFPQSAGFVNYKVLASASGTGPSRFGVEIPLSVDPLFWDTFNGNYHIATATDMHGSLDISGDAIASLDFPAGLSSSLVGRAFFLAAVVIQPGQLPAHSSVAISVEITP
jgi:hypothetical protein